MQILRLVFERFCELDKVLAHKNGIGALVDIGYGTDVRCLAEPAIERGARSTELYTLLNARIHIATVPHGVGIDRKLDEFK